MKDKDAQLIFEAYLKENSIEDKFMRQVDLIAAQIDRGRRDEFDVHDFLKFKPHIKNWEKLISAVEEENHPLSDGWSDLWNEIQFISEGTGDDPDSDIKAMGVYDRPEGKELPRIGSRVEIADDAGGGTGNVVGHEGDRAVVELENEVVKLFNNFDIVELPSDDF